MRLNGEQKVCIIINIRLVDFFLELSHGSDEILTMSQTKSFLIKNQVSVSFFSSNSHPRPNYLTIPFIQFMVTL